MKTRSNRMRLPAGLIAFMRPGSCFTNTVIEHDDDVGLYYYFKGEFHRVRKTDGGVIRPDRTKAAEDDKSTYDLYLYKSSTVRSTIGQNAFSVEIDGRAYTVSIDFSYRIYDLPLFAMSVMSGMRSEVREQMASEVILQKILEHINDNGIPHLVGDNIVRELESASKTLKAELGRDLAVLGSLGIELTAFRISAR